MPYTPAQVSEMLKIPSSTIRLYAKIFEPYLSSQIGRKQRLYTEKDILILGRIKEMRSQHIPIDAIGPRLQVEPQNKNAEESSLSLIPTIAGEIENAHATARAALARIDYLEKLNSEQDKKIEAISNQVRLNTAQLEAIREWSNLPWWKKIFVPPPKVNP